MDAQRYLKYHDEVRELQVCPTVNKPMARAKSQQTLPLYMRSQMIAKSHDKNIKDKQMQRQQQLEQQQLDEMRQHELQSVHNKVSRDKFTVEGTCLHSC